jgi:hypothetical protein
MLDLRYNGLRDLEDLGLRAASEDPEEAVNSVAECGVALQKLDLRYNTIQALTPGEIVFPSIYINHTSAEILEQSGGGGMGGWETRRKRFVVQAAQGPNF